MCINSSRWWSSIWDTVSPFFLWDPSGLCCSHPGAVARWTHEGQTVTNCYRSLSATQAVLLLVIHLSTFLWQYLFCRLLIFSCVERRTFARIFIFFLSCIISILLQYKLEYFLAESCNGTDACISGDIGRQSTLACYSTFSGSADGSENRGLRLRREVQTAERDWDRRRRPVRPSGNKAASQDCPGTHPGVSTWATVLTYKNKNKTETKRPEHKLQAGGKDLSCPWDRLCPKCHHLLIKPDHRCVWNMSYLRHTEVKKSHFLSKMGHFPA